MKIRRFNYTRKDRKVWKVLTTAAYPTGFLLSDRPPERQNYYKPDGNRLKYQVMKLEQKFLLK